jgi:hypothetical protein
MFASGYYLTPFIPEGDRFLINPSKRFTSLLLT